MLDTVQLDQQKLSHFLDKVVEVFRTQAYTARFNGTTLGFPSINAAVLRKGAAIDAHEAVRIVTGGDPMELCELAGIAVRTNKFVSIQLAEWFQHINPSEIISAESICVERCRAILPELSDLDRHSHSVDDYDSIGGVSPWSGGTVLELSLWLIRHLLIPQIKERLGEPLGVQPVPNLNGSGLHHHRQRRLDEVKTAQKIAGAAL
jgi:hypothetical protein